MLIIKAPKPYSHPTELRFRFMFRGAVAALVSEPWNRPGSEGRRREGCLSRPLSLHPNE